MKIRCDYILPNPQQPRLEFNQDELEELAESIEINGLIQPIVVEQAGGEYILIDGERRLRAVKLLGWPEIEAVVRPSSNGNGQRERLALALVANLQRSDLRPVEEAQAFFKLRHEVGLSAVEIAQRVGRSSSHVLSRLRLLEFPTEILNLFNMGRLPIDERVFGALRKLDVEDQLRVARAAAMRRMTVAQVAGLCTRTLNGYAFSGGHATPALSRRHRGGDTSGLPVVIHHEGAVSWETIEAAAKATCEACSLFDMASPVNCKDCPARDLVSRLSQGG